MKGGPDLEDGPHAAGNNSPNPVPDPRWSPHPVRRQQWLAKVGARPYPSLAGERVRVRAGSGARAPDRGHQAASRGGTVTGRAYPSPGKHYELVATAGFD